MSKIIYQTFTFNAAKTNLRQRVGSFDESNGIFLEQTSSVINIVLRSKVTGSVVDTIIPQASWNLDKLDGTGSSGITLNLSKAQILFIDTQWLGAGRVRIGFIINGKYIVAHEFLHSNVIDTVYCPTSKWHLRFEIENVGTTSSTSILYQICSSIVIEGSTYDPPGTVRTANCGTTTRSLSNGVKGHIISIRNSNDHVTILPLKTSICIISSNDIFYEIILNATITGGAWVQSSNYADKNVSATAISGGTVISSGYIRAGSQIGSIVVGNDIGLFLGHFLNGTKETYSLAITPLSSNGNAIAAIDYQEVV